MRPACFDPQHRREKRKIRQRGERRRKGEGAEEKRTMVEYWGNMGSTGALKKDVL
jgi:hypothetical protein